MQFDKLDREGLMALAKPFGEAVERVATVGGAWIDPDVQQAFQAAGVSLSRNHYYSVIPDISTLPGRLWQGRAFSDAWSQVACSDYLPLLNEVLTYIAELSHIKRDSGGGFYWNNPMYPPLDAAVYYGLIRTLRPARLLEVGSGFSTFLALAATEANGIGSVSCIEPYPRPELIACEDQLSVLHRVPVQDVSIDLFMTLQSGDMLFIDTSHTLKAGSDVHDIIFRVLPTLSAGVIVHIHDIFLPYEYPEKWYKDIGIIWNEQYAILALLMNSSRYKVIIPNYLASIEQETWLKSSFSGLEVDGLTMNMGGARGASLWLEVCG